MSIRTITTTALTTTGVAALGLVTAAASASGVAAPVAAPSVIGTHVVAGSLSPASFQQSLNQAYMAKKVAEAVAIREAVTVKWQAQAAASQAAAAAAATASQPSVAAAAAAAPASAGSAAAPAAQSSGGSADASSWANSAKSMSVKNCESGNNYSTNTGNGYYGAWQFDIPSWNANGGAAYAATPDQAPAWAQDQVAYNYYQAAGWGPWACG